MYLKCLLIFISCVYSLEFGNNLDGDSSWKDEVITLDHFDSDKGYYLYIPKKKKSGEVVVFIHGYGALNPMIYGSWIKHLCSQGHAVIYPRYQDKILGTKAKEFAKNVASAVNKATTQLAKRKVKVSKHFHFTGHSYGGAISAYIGIYYRRLSIPKPKTILLSQPGTGLFKGMRLNSYQAFDSNIPFAVVVGSNDLTVGESMGKTIYQTTDLHKQKVFIRHHEDKNVEPAITASHYEPYAIDIDLDNNIENYTSKKAIDKSVLNEVDKLYWDLLDSLIDNPASLFESDVAIK